MSYPPPGWPPPRPPKRKRSPFLILALVGAGAVALFVVLAIVVTLAIGAATPSEEERAQRAEQRAAERSTSMVEQRTSSRMVLSTAEDLCSEIMERRFGEAAFSGWTITTELAPDEWSNPRWRIFGRMSTPAGVPRGFYCDVTWQMASDRYVAALAG